MSSTNKTPNLGLSQWVLSDPFNMADFNEDNAKIDAAVSAAPLVKLIDVTLAAAAATVELNLRGIDIAAYASLRVYHRSGPGDSMNIRLNKVSDGYMYLYGGNWQSPSSYCYGGDIGYIDIELAPVNIYIHNPYRLTKPSPVIQVSALRTIEMIRDPNNESNVYPAGTRFILLGVRK